DDVFLLMVVFGTKNFIDDVAVVRQEDQAFGVLVQSTDWEDTFRVSDQIDDVVLDVSFGGASDSGGLVERNVDLRSLGTDQLAVDAHLVTGADPSTQGGALPVAGDSARFNPLVRLAPRTDTGFADVLVEPHRQGLGVAA